MNLNAATSKFSWNSILAIAAVMCIGLILYKVFVKQYVTSDGIIHTSFKAPSIKVDNE